MNGTETSFSLLQLFQMGGIFMWPLLVFSIVTVAIAIERAVYILSRDLHVMPAANSVSGFIKNGNLRGAAAFLGQLPQKCQVKPVLAKLIENAGLEEHQVENSVETEAQLVITDMEAGFNFLPAIGSLAPLTGFLGTVSGMIGAFHSIATAAEVNAQIVANGIYEALITTVFGLIIAIVAMVAHALLSAAVDRFTLDTEQALSRLITEMAIKNIFSKAEGTPPVATSVTRNAPAKAPGTSAAPRAPVLAKP
jgi:biopolymer transport protein ExbB